MFKLTGKGGLRRASGASSSGAGRIGGLHGLRGADTSVSRRRRPAGLPDTPEEQGFDNDSIARISEPGKRSQGYTGSNIGA